MSSTSSGKRYLLIAGRILILLVVVIGALQSGIPASYIDPYGFIFVLVGGVALLMISFPGTDILRALRHAAGSSGTNAELKNSAHFWEAAGRGFWILGGLRSVLSMVIGFVNMRNVEVAPISAIIPILIRSLLSTFYGSLLAVICFVPCWKLMAKIQKRLQASSSECNDTPASFVRPGWGFGTVVGYALFLAALVSTCNLPNLHLMEVWTVFRPPLLVVLGGSLALMLFMGGSAQP